MVSSTLCRCSSTLSIGIILHSYLLVPMGRKYKWLTKSPFLAINAKGGESIKPKAKGPHHHHFNKFRNEVLIGIFQLSIYFNWCILKIVFDINWYLCFTWFVKVNFQLVSNLQLILKLVSFPFSNWYLIKKPSWKLRGEFHSGRVLFNQRKNIWNRGRNFKSWKCFLQSYSYTFDYLQKEFEKIYQKNLQKQTCGAKVVQNVK